ncbi:MAG: class I SAM-dependent methyltransferase [Gaiellaceae bacterium]
MTKRAGAFAEFLSVQLPPPPARVLEVGCGRGELAHALAKRGFEVIAIDPSAPEGTMFRRVELEDFSDPRGFDAVVASVSLHHIDDLAGAVDKIASFLPRNGVLALEEFAKERLAGATARWYYHQRRALAAAGREDAVPETFDQWQRQSDAGHDDIHPVSEIRAALENRFVERYFEWTPYLYSHRLDDAVEPLERALIAEGAIDAAGLWYVGERL